MAAASTLEERLLRERQGAYLGQVALFVNREENAKRKKSGGLVAVNFDNKNGSPYYCFCLKIWLLNIDRGIDTRKGRQKPV